MRIITIRTNGETTIHMNLRNSMLKWHNGLKKKVQGNSGKLWKVLNNFKKVQKTFKKVLKNFKKVQKKIKKVSKKVKKSSKKCSK